MNDTTPWWEGKKNRDMKGMKVHVTFKSGTEATGVLDTGGKLPQTRFHDLTVSDTTTPDDLFRPAKYVESVELIEDDADCIRIDHIEGMRKGDVFVSKSGARYPVCETIDPVHLDDPCCLVEVEPGDPGLRTWIGGNFFAYGLRKSQGPSHAGIWRNAAGDLVVVAENGDGRYIRRDGRWDADDRRVASRELLNVLGPWIEYAPAGNVANMPALCDKCAEAIIENAADADGWLSDAYLREGNPDINLYEGVTVGGYDIDIYALVEVVLRTVQKELK